MRCLIIAKEAEVIIDNLLNIFPDIDFGVCADIDSASGRYDVILLSRFLCNRKRLPEIATRFALSHIVLLVGELDEDCMAYIKVAKSSGLTNVVSGKLPGDRPYTIMQALQEAIDEGVSNEPQEDTKPINLLDQPEQEEPAQIFKLEQEEPIQKISEQKILEQDDVFMRKEMLLREIKKLTKELENTPVQGKIIQKPLKPAPVIREKASSSKSTLITIAANKGGVGKTTTAATLAIALANARVPVTMVDLDFHGANVCVFFGLTPSRGIDSLSGLSDVAIKHQLPGLLLETKHENLTVLPGIVNKSVVPKELFSSEELLNIVKTLISPVVIVDTPPGFWAYDYLFDTFVSSDMLLAVVDQSSFSKDDVKSYAPYLFSMGVSPEKIKIVLNRFSPKLSRAREIEKFFAESVSSKEKPQIIATIPNDWDAHVISSSRSEAVGLKDPKNQWHQVAGEIAAMSGFRYGQKVNHRKTLKEILKPNLMSLWKNKKKELSLWK